MMHMTFYWSRQVTLLFSSWRTDSWPSYALTLLACVLASVFYQYLEHARYAVRRGENPSAAAEEPLLSRANRFGGGKWSGRRIAGGVLFGVSSGLGYLLMLAIMSFNGGVFVAIVVGLMVGYLGFRSEDDDEIAGVNSTCACA
ncbi:hypothetical protein GQ457_10G001580 [Hibiscus cannabinus]